MIYFTTLDGGTARFDKDAPGVRRFHNLDSRLPIPHPDGTGVFGWFAPSLWMIPGARWVLATGEADPTEVTPERALAWWVESQTVVEYLHRGPLGAGERPETAWHYEPLDCLLGYLEGEAGPATAPSGPPPETSPPTPPIGPELVEVIRRGVGKRSKGSGQRAALVKYMLERESASYQDIAHHVHGDAGATEDAIESNVRNTNKDLVEYGSRLKLRLRGGHVVREISPE